jgi:hypothetical protein
LLCVYCHDNEIECAGENGLTGCVDCIIVKSPELLVEVTLPAINSFKHSEDDIDAAFSLDNKENIPPSQIKKRKLFHEMDQTELDTHSNGIIPALAKKLEFSSGSEEPQDYLLLSQELQQFLESL